MSTFNQRLMTLIFCVKCEWKRPKCSRKEDLKDKQCIFKRVYLFNSLNNHFFHLWMVLTKIAWERLINEVNVFSFWGGGYDTLLLKQGKILFWNIFQFPFAQKWFFAKFFLYFNLVFFMTIWKWERQRKWRRQKRLKNTNRKKTQALV